MNIQTQTKKKHGRQFLRSVLQGILAAGLFFVVPALAAPGNLDRTFGTGGIVNTSGNNNLRVNFASGMAIQSDGKIVAVGDGFNDTGGGRDFAVVRYNSNGSLDSSFGGTGIVLTSIGDSDSGASSVAIQMDGKIVVAGYSYPNSFAVIRYNTDGSLDTSFNGTGIVTTVVSKTFGWALSVAIQSDGKIVAGGFSRNGTYNDFALIRYRTDGSLDLSFSGGIVFTPVGDTGDEANSISIQSDGKIVAAGRTGSSFAVVRYSVWGQLDTSFNGTGKVMTSFGTGFRGSIRGLAIQWDGKIVVAGQLDNFPTPPAFVFARYYSNGKLDTSFGGTGKIIIPVGETFGGHANSVAIQPDGKIVAAGKIDKNLAVIRLNSNGPLDTTFNGTGIVSTPAAYNTAAVVAIQADGKIVAAGGDDNEGIDFVMVRYQGGPFRVNGKIAFTSDRDSKWEIYVMNNDGTQQVRLTNNNVTDLLPAFSPDGRKIAFVSQQTPGNGVAANIKIMNADGTNQTVLTPITLRSTSPTWREWENSSLSWSPDGSKIAFDEEGEIFTINVDGSNRTNLTNHHGDDIAPAWSPDGSRILFTSHRVGYLTMHTMKPDGSDVKMLPSQFYWWDVSPDWSPTGDKIVFTELSEDWFPIIKTADADGTNRKVFEVSGPSGGTKNMPKWSPDSTKIVFHHWKYPEDDCEIYVKNADGTGLTQLTDTIGNNGQPSWAPRTRTISPISSETDPD